MKRLTPWLVALAGLLTSMGAEAKSPLNLRNLLAISRG